jgi:hypothetical protein
MLAAQHRHSPNHLITAVAAVFGSCGLDSHQELASCCRVQQKGDPLQRFDSNAIQLFMSDNSLSLMAMVLNLMLRGQRLARHMAASCQWTLQAQTELPVQQPFTLFYPELELLVCCCFVFRVAACLSAHTISISCRFCCYCY